MVVKRKDFQKAAAFIHEFLLKLSEDVECAELRDTLNLALLHMQKYYRVLQSKSQEKNTHHTLSLSARGLSPMTPFVDAPDKFRWRWLNLDNARLPSNMSVSDSINLTSLPPIICAVKAANLDVIHQLAAQDAANKQGIVDSCDGIGRTALMYAVHHSQDSALNMLLECGADVNATAHDGSAAVHYACHEGNVGALSLLLDYHADARILDCQGRAPIHWAVTTPSTECLELLLEHGIEAWMRDKDGLTPCMWACRMDHIQHFELLSQADPSPDQDGIEKDGCGRTWMHWAVRRTEPLECLQTLLTPESAGYKDEDGKTVMMLAAEIGSLSAARLIVEIGGRAVVDDCDDKGRTALHLATIGGHGDVVNFLLEQGADINQVDQSNATAWDYARTRSLHYCQLIIMSHQRQRLLSTPSSPQPNGLPALTHTDSGVQEDFRRMTIPPRSDHPAPITPPHPPKRPRTSHRLQRRANSFSSGDVSERLSHAPFTNHRRSERIEVTVNTMQVGGSDSSPAFFPSSRQDSKLTEDMNNVINDVDIDHIDNVSEGGMDVSDIEDADQLLNGDQGEGQDGGGQDPPSRARLASPPRAKLSPVDRRPLPHPRPPMAVTVQPVPPPPPATPSYVQPLEPPGKHASAVSHVPGIASGPQAIVSQSQSPGGPSYSPQAPPRPTLRATQRGSRPSAARAPVPSPPNTDPQRAHMIRQHQPLPPQPSLKDREPARQLSPHADSLRVEQAASPPLSSQSSDQVSVRTQISVGLGPIASGTTSAGSASSENRPNSGGTAKSPQSVAIEGRRIPPPMLTPLHNAPKPPLQDIFGALGDGPPESKKKKKKKKGRQEKEQEPRSPPQNPLEIPPPRGYAAPLHPQQARERGASAAVHGARHSKGQPQQQSQARFVEENGADSDPPVGINGFAAPVREGTLRSARPMQRSAAVIEQESPGPAGDAGSGAVSETVSSSIREEEEVGEMSSSGPLIPPPHAFQGPSQPSWAQDKSAARMMVTSAKPPLPQTSRSSASLTRRSSDKSLSPTRRSRPPTSRK